MYCSNCGAEQPAPELNYCKNCGSALNAASIICSTQSAGLSAGAAWGIGLSTFLLVVGGMGVIAGILDDLSRRPNITGGNLVFIAFFGFITLLIAALGLIIMPFALTQSSQTKVPAGVKNKKRSWLFGRKTEMQPAPLFAPANSYAQLSEARTPLSSVASVTENTTRNLETMRREPRN
jgi:hypothetical protein